MYTGVKDVLARFGAVLVNVQIIRTFTKLRELLATHADLRRKIEEMEAKYDRQFKAVFEALKLLLTEEEKPKREIGFRGEGK